MTHYELKNEVDLDQYPNNLLEHRVMQDDQLTIGDLHGNALKLLHALVRYGFIKMSEEDYEQFKDIYYKTNLQKEDLKKFNKIIDRLKIRKEAKLAHLRLLGDVFADRGSNDYFTLCLLKKLHTEHVPFEIILSNHDADFIEAFEKKRPFTEGLLAPLFRASGINLQKLIDKGLVSRTEIDEMIENFYYPHLKLVGYSQDEVTGKPSFYGHALWDLNALAQIHYYFKEHDPAYQYKENWVDIDELNKSFYRMATSQHKITDLLNLRAIPGEAIDNIIPIDREKYPFAYLIYNRRAEGLHRPSDVNFVHGHDDSEPSRDNIYNLDTKSGKTSSLHKAPFPVLFSVGERPKLTKRVTEEEKENIDALTREFEKLSLKEPKRPQEKGKKPRF